MALGHAVLAALLEGEASGYELAKRFDVSVANFWSTTPQQLYRELDRLAEAGLVAARVIEQERRPNKRSFTLTVAGREELLEFTRRPARAPALRDDLAVKLQAVDVGDAEAVLAALSERLQRAGEKLALYDRIHERMLAGRTEEGYLQAGERIGPYLTLMAGRMYEQQSIRWAEAAIALLAERSAATQGAVHS